MLFLKKFIPILLIISLAACETDDSSDPTNTNETTVDSPYEFTFGDHSYSIVFENLNWESAAAYASERDGYLTEINSKEEQDTIQQVLLTLTNYYDQTTASDGGDYTHFWIGANDLSDEGAWVWDGNNDNVDVNQFWQGAQDGSSVNDLYNNWGNEPSNGAGGQHAAGIVPVGWTNGDAGTWNDVKESNELFFIVEFND